MQYTYIYSCDERVSQAWEELLGMESYIEAMGDKKKASWAIEHRDVIQGFFRVNFKETQFDALYAHPLVHNQGLGITLLSRAEKLAACADLSSMKLYASLNSVPLYRLNSYELLGVAILLLNETVRVKCELVRKCL